jgi:hypothetical protein
MEFSEPFPSERSTSAANPFSIHASARSNPSEAIATEILACGGQYAKHLAFIGIELWLLCWCHRKIHLLFGPRARSPPIIQPFFRFELSQDWQITETGRGIGEWEIIYSSARFSQPVTAR